MSFGLWIGDQKPDDLIEYVKTLSYNELKIAMNCGLHGKSMTTAMLRLDEYKDHRERIEREELTGEKPLDEDKPMFDTSKGFEQLDPELIKALIQNSSNEEITGIANIFMQTMEERGLIPSPEQSEVT